MDHYELSRLPEGFVGRRDSPIRETVYAKLRNGQTLAMFWRDLSSEHVWRTWKEWEKK